MPLTPDGFEHSRALTMCAFYRSSDVSGTIGWTDAALG